MNATVIKSILATLASFCTAGAGALATTKPSYSAVLASLAGLFVVLAQIVSGKATDAKIAASKAAP
jgi:hypothetical protein